MFEKPENKKKSPFFDYKNPLSIYDYLDGAKIQAARYNRLTSRQQKSLKVAIKKARNLGLIPTHFQSFDDFKRPEPISPKPFSC